MDAQLLQGIIPPLISPLTDRMDLDREGLYKLIEHVIAGGVSGIFLLGSTGEGPSLDRLIRHQLIDTALEAVAGRVPVLLNISSSSYLETLHLAEYAAKSGADFVVLTAPSYFPMNQDELIRYMLKVADHTELPLLLYNAPQYSGKILEPSTVKTLCGHDKIIGIKDSSGQMGYVHHLLDLKAEMDLKVYIGPEQILASCLQLGCCGGVNGGANVFPHVYVNLYQIAVGKDQKEAQRITALISRVHDTIYSLHDSPMGIVIALKYALSVRGICTPTMAMPIYGELSRQQKRSIEEFTWEMMELGY